MEINELLIYLITRLDAIKNGITFLSFIGVVGLIASIIYCVYHITYKLDGDVENDTNKKIKWGIGLVVVMVMFIFSTIFVNCLIPTSKNMCVIIGVPKVIKTAKDFYVDMKNWNLWDYINTKMNDIKLDNLKE
jgi:uncharacterized membrane-anchored protein